MISRRHVVMGGPAVLPLARPSLAQSNISVLRFVPSSDLASLDPIWTTANVTRHHAFLIYDTLYGLDADLSPQPQMAEEHAVEDAGLTCTITLRPGLRFHNGEPVLARDAVASLTRWMQRNSGGQYIAAHTDELLAVDDRRLRFRLKRPQPRLLGLLASLTSPVAFIMPEAVARTDGFTQMRSTVGSGPFRFKNDEYRPGNRIVYERNPDYVPTQGGGRGLSAGAKTVHFDRVEWNVVPDPATAAAALQAGEVDWYEAPPSEILELLQRSRAVAVEPMDTRPAAALLRLNHLHPPFNNPDLRRAILPALDQRDFMFAAVGTDPDRYVVDCGFFTPGTPLATQAGLEPLLGPRSIERARTLLREAKYNGQPARVLLPTDSVSSGPIAQVGADLLRRIGFTVEVVAADWSTVVQRRNSRESLERGGWSVFPTVVNSLDFADPAVHFALRGNGASAWLGWPTSPRLEALRDAWFAAADLPAQQAIAAQMQSIAMEELPYLPVGATRAATALSRKLRDRVIGFPVFWKIRRE